MKMKAFVAVLILAMAAAAFSGEFAINTTKISDTIRAQQIKELKWGMFICWSFSTFSGQEWTRDAKSVDAFKAEEVDTDQWCKTARDAGMGYILFLTKHHDGFCLWDTETTDWKVTKAKLGRDVLAELKKSCDSYGLKLALYFSEGDWTWAGKSESEQAKIQKAQLRELATRYGPVEFWWMDHAQGVGGLEHAAKVEWIHSFQPNSFVGFNHGDPAGRLCLRERGNAGMLGDSTATRYNKAEGRYQGYLVAEFTYPILPDHKGGAQWFYSLPVHDHLCHPAEKLYRDYLEAVKYGNIFSIDVGPDYRGRLRDIDVKTLKQVGEMIRAGGVIQPEHAP